MTDLHRPLGQNDKNKSRGKFVRVIYVGIAVAMLGFTVYRIVKSRDAASTVVALNDGKQMAESSAPDSNTVPDTTPAKPTNAPVTKPENAQPPTPAEPDFKPRQTALAQQKAWLPVPELTEKSDFGPLPITGTSGLRPLDAYSEPPTNVGRVRVAIVIGGLGISQTGTKRAIENLPSSITLAYSPVGNSLQRWMQVARKEGHEIVLQIPMEPLGYPSVDPGRSTLISSADNAANIANLRWSLGRVTNYPVVMNYLGANYLNNAELLRPILEEIKARGLGWLDDGSVQASTSLDIAEELRLPHANGSFVLDGQRNAAKIQAQLKGLELFARRRGFAIATATAFPESVKQIAKWAKTAQKNGIQIVPLSNLIRDYSR